MTTPRRDFDRLNERNYGQWSSNMSAFLKTKRLWDVTSDATLYPLPINPSLPTPEEAKEIRDWKVRSGMASGEIWLALEDGQKVHVQAVKDEPIKMWEKLKEVHLQQCPGTRFNAYDQLFGLRKEEGETLGALTGRADKALQDIKALCPPSFTIEQLDEELVCMSLIRSLPDDYNNFVSSLMLLDSLSLDKLQSAFHNKETQRASRNSAPTTSLAHKAYVPPSAASNSLCCTFCDYNGHDEASCYAKQRAMVDAKAKTLEKREKRPRGGKKNQNAKEATEEAGNSAQAAE